MKKENITLILSIVNTVAIVVIAVLLMVGNNQPLGGGTRMIHGLSTDSTSPSSGEVRTTTLTVTGASTLSSTLGVTATTTLSDTVNFNNSGICINFYATSTATRTRLVASTTATIEGVDGVMMWEYGACAL